MSEQGIWILPDQVRLLRYVEAEYSSWEHKNPNSKLRQLNPDHRGVQEETDVEHGKWSENLKDLSRATRPQ